MFPLPGSGCGFGGTADTFSIKSTTYGVNWRKDVVQFT